MVEIDDGHAVVEVSGYTLHVKAGEIVRLSHMEKVVYPGQNVTSNGRIVPAGTRGVVVSIQEPYTGNCTSDCIMVA